MRKTLLLITLITGLISSSYSQQEAQYSMYRFNSLYINPAYSGSHEVISAMAAYRHQWVKIPGQPQTATVAVHSPLPNDKVALGLIYTYDRIGVTKTHSIDASFAYRIPLGKKKNIRLCFGISAGAMNYNSDLNSVLTTDDNDPNFAGNSQNLWLPNVGVGIYAYSEKFFVGVSAPKILANRLQGKLKVFETSGTVARQYYHLLVSGGYVFSIGKKVKFMPSILMKYVPVNAPITADFNATFIFVDRVWLGAGYRLNDSYNFMTAVNITKQLKLGYCYDLTVSPLTKFTTGSHEIVLSFDALFEHGNVISPRYVKYF